MNQKRTPVGMLITVALLAIFAIYGVWTAITDESLVYAIVGAVAIVACLGTAMLKPWSSYLVYLLTATFIGMWGYSLYSAAAVGYFGLYSILQIARQLAPGILLILLSCVCNYLVFRQFHASRPQPDTTQVPT
jgi:hypothetical protein